MSERARLLTEAGACGHVWAVCYLPMQLDKAAALMKAARCPMCGGGKVFVG